MKRRKVDSQRERRVLIAMITCTPFLKRVAKTLELDLVDTPHFRQVAEWCLDHFKEYGKAPGENIETIYYSWAEDNENKDLVESVHDFLDALGQEYGRADELNVPFLVDEFAELITKRKLQRLQEDVEYGILKGNVKEAEKTLLSYRSVAVGQQGTGIDPLRDKDAWSRTFQKREEAILTFEGAAGDFFNAAMTRDALVAIQAPEKNGKTMWMIEFMFRALRQRRRVAMFQVGDLSEAQVMKRLGMRLSDRPLWASQCGKILVPVRIVVDEDEEAGYRIEHKAKRVREPLSEVLVRRNLRKFRRACGLAKGKSYVKVSVHPMSSINVKGIGEVLDQWVDEEDFIPDVILVDYADILAPEESGRRHEHDRNIINDTWKALRTLSQKRHALVITATQANAASYTQEAALQTMKNFSEDKRKLAHVTGMFALNQTPEEKEIQGMRVNWIVLREAPYNITRPLYVGTCYPLGRALCVASM